MYYSLVLEGNAREHAINRLVTSHVSKAEKARRHGRELSFILPHNSVENFAPLFSAIEHEIKTRSSRLGINSYGVSMTTLEEVFLHLEKDEETECTMDNLSKKMVRNRALSRSLSLQSKSTSYQSLQNEGITVQGDSQGKSEHFNQFGTCVFSFVCFLHVEQNFTLIFFYIVQQIRIIRQ